MAIVNDIGSKLRALCVARHSFIAEHLGRFFTTLGIETMAVVGLEQVVAHSRDFTPDVVICEYELLSVLSLEGWERHELLSRCPVVAVSLTRKAQEAHVTDASGIGGFLYLPLLNPEAAMRLIRAASVSPCNPYLPPLPPASEAESTET